MNLAREASFRLGAMEVRPATRELVFDGRREVLEPRVMAVLVRLAQAKGEVVTRDDLTEACWEGRVVSDDAINRVISRIRRASDLTGGKDFTLETITKVGYRLVAAPPAGRAPDRPAVPPANAASETPPAKARRPALLLGLLAAMSAVVVATFAWWMFRPQPDPAPDARTSLTLAVLPFDSLGGSQEDAALAVAMSREIRNTLSRVRGLRVISDASSFAVAAEPLSASDIGERLNATLLLDGSLSREGETIQLSAELVDSASGVNLWTGSQSGSAADLDRLRLEMSAAIFEQLVTRLGPERLERTAEPKREDPRVYRLLIKAWQARARSTQLAQAGEVEQALDNGDEAYVLVEQALAISPESPAALTTMGGILATSSTHALAARDLYGPQAMAEAAVYFRRALASDPDNANALWAVGEYYRRFEWRWDEARALLERALALDPNFFPAHRDYAYLLSGAGRCVDGLKHARILFEIDPETYWWPMTIPRLLKCLGRFEEADAAYRDVLAHDPGNLFALREIYLNMLLRRDAAALRKLRGYVRDDLWKGAPSAPVQVWLDWTDAAANALDGDAAPFVAMLEASAKDATTISRAGSNIVNSVRRRPDDNWMLALEFAIVGKPDRAIDLLQTAIQGGSLYIPETLPYGAFEFTPEVRADPRYQAIWKSNPRLVELVAMRLESLKAGQMMGVLPDGTKVVPKMQAADD
jgi:TolB-like protein/DNA-binding winged helix-turn-helix (wHTH) protein